MRIAIINPTGGGIGGGYRKYLLNMIPRMSQHANVDALLCIAPASLQMYTWFERLPNVQYADCVPYRFMHHKPDKALKVVLDSFNPDVLFVPIERYINYQNVPLVTMIKNMEPLASPVRHALMRERMRCYAQYIEAKIAAKRSARVISISNFSKAFLMRAWRIPEAKISTVYFGTTMPADAANVKPQSIPECRNGFLFTAGTIERYRGIEDLIDAVKYLKEDKHIDVQLIIAGGVRVPMKQYRVQLENAIRKNNLSRNIFFVGHLSANDLSWCYRNCSMFIMTSRIEAFPNVAFEAMAHGCLCVSSTFPPMPEAFDDAAVYYDPNDKMSLGKTIIDLMSWSREKRSNAEQRAKKRAAGFSWDECVAKTVNELETVLSKG